MTDVTEAGLFCWTHNPGIYRQGGEHFDGNWVPDYGGKQDYDPVFMSFSCRVYPDGSWTASLCLGEDTKIEGTGIINAGTVADARKAAEEWCKDTAKRWAGVIRTFEVLKSNIDEVKS